MIFRLTARNDIAMHLLQGYNRNLLNESVHRIVQYVDKSEQEITILVGIYDILGVLSYYRQVYDLHKVELQPEVFALAQTFLIGVCENTPDKSIAEAEKAFWSALVWIRKYETILSVLQNQVPTGVKVISELAVPKLFIEWAKNNKTAYQIEAYSEEKAKGMLAHLDLPKLLNSAHMSLNLISDGFNSLLNTLDSSNLYLKEMYTLHQLQNHIIVLGGENFG